jgi:predicted nucleic acid-binding protein
MATSPKLVAYLPLIPRAYDIASQLRIGIYDCLCVACAEKEKCELLSADDKLLKNAQQQFPFVRHLNTLP